MNTVRRVVTGVALLAILILPAGTSLRAAGGEKVPPKPPEPEAPEVPAIPAIPGPPKVPMAPKGERMMATTARYHLKPGESHKGDLYFMSESVTIEGTQQGDLMVFGRDLEITGEGTVTGDVNAWVQSAELAGTMGDSVRVFCAELKVRGTIDGDLMAACATVLVEKGAHITGDLEAKGADIEIHGIVDGGVDVTGGQVALSGTVGGDAALKGDIVEVDSDAKVGGSLQYRSRDRIESDLADIVRGEVTYGHPRRKHDDDSSGFAVWMVLVVTALLTGLGALALFRDGASRVVSNVKTDALRSAGIGFITMIVIPVAALLSIILIITIPAALLVILAWALLVYLSQVPVAVFVGDLVLRRIGRRDPSVFAAFAVGIPLMYILFKIPVIGTLAIFATGFIGFGAIIISLWSAWQARQGTGMPGGQEPPVVSAPAAPAPA